MAEEFEIGQGDYGRVFRGIIKNENHSDCTGVINVWNKERTALLINAGACSVSFVDPDTYIEYTVKQGDFDVEVGTYYGNFVLWKAGFVEHTLKCTVTVFEIEPTIP